MGFMLHEEHMPQVFDNNILSQIIEPVRMRSDENFTMRNLMFMPFT